MIQICSLLSLLVVFASISASAQSEYGREVEIPFAFSVGDRSYDEGKYVVRIARLQSGIATLSIQDPKTDSFQKVIVNADVSNTDNGVKLVFDTVENKKVLSRLVTPSGTFALSKRKAQREDANRLKLRTTKAEAAIAGGSGLF